ncbi:MAG TPA: hypothetical protein VHK86_01465 [Nitrososphaera sp.]|jgi:hypothetical protein|nr:hypothetical protein [Nitrososphaera sp.]HEX2614336.1 hypothetical protein [Nitrososphaera sp.]
MDIQPKRAPGLAGGKWARRFIAAAMVQGAVIVGLTIFLVVGEATMKPDVARVIAGGSAGTWFTFGYLVYIIVGVIGVAVSSLFYHYLEQGYHDSGRAFGALGWAHLVLMNIGVTAAASMMMLAGYQGGAAMLPPAVGGQGFDAGQAHEIIGPYVEPIGASILILMAGVIAGGAGFLIAYRRQNMFVQSDTKRDTEAA